MDDLIATVFGMGIGFTLVVTLFGWVFQGIHHYIVMKNLRDK